MIDHRLVAELAKALREEPLRDSFADEEDFERRFVEPLCREVLTRLAPTVHLAVHPWGDQTKAPAWRESKRWGAVRVWGMAHSFDLVAIDPASRKSLAVEVKLARISGGRLPTGEFQRMAGQCLLARLKHEAVIGVFGYHGQLPERWPEETKAAERVLADRYGIWLIIRKAG